MNLFDQQSVKQTLILINWRNTMIGSNNQYINICIIYFYFLIIKYISYQTLWVWSSISVSQFHFCQSNILAWFLYFYSSMTLGYFLLLLVTENDSWRADWFSDRKLKAKNVWMWRLNVCWTRPCLSHPHVEICCLSSVCVFLSASLLCLSALGFSLSADSL